MRSSNSATCTKAGRPWLQLSCPITFTRSLGRWRAARRRSRRYSAGLKRFVRRETNAVWKWLDGVFDRLLRRDECAESKWIYMRENPVRAGLVRASGRLAVRDRVSRVGRAILAAPGAFTCPFGKAINRAARMARPTRQRGEFRDRSAAVGPHRWATATSGPGRDWFWGRRSRRGSIPCRRRA